MQQNCYHRFIPEGERTIDMTIRLSQAGSLEHIHHHKFKLGNVLLVVEEERPCKYDF